MTNEEGGVDPEESRYEVLVDRANTTATVWLGSTLGVRAVPQPQVRSVHAEGLLPAARVLRERRLRQPDVRRRHPLVRADARSRHAGAGNRAQGAAGRHRSPRQGAEDVHAGAARGAGALGGVAARRRRPNGHRSRRSDATATNGVLLRSMPDGSILASGPNPPLTAYTVTGTTTARAASPACESKPCRIRRCRAAVPGATATAISASPACASLAGRRGCEPRRRSRWPSRR